MTQNAGGDHPVFRVMTEIGITNQLATSAFERVLPHGLTLSQFAVLHHFARLGGAWSPLRLARAFQVTKGAMTNTLQRLEARGFVTIAADPADGRGKLVTLTLAGAAAREEAVACLAPLVGDIIAAFGEARFEEALPFLSALRAFLDKARD